MNVEQDSEDTESTINVGLCITEKSGRHKKLYNCLCINADSSTSTFQNNEAPISNHKKWDEPCLFNKGSSGLRLVSQFKLLVNWPTAQRKNNERKSDQKKI